MRAGRTAAAAPLLLLVVACGGGGGGGDDANPGGAAKPAATSGVSVKSLAFAPGSHTVAAGTEVTWTNDEAIDHTVTSGPVTGVDATTGLRSGQTPDGKFDGPLTGKGSTFAFRFAEPGTYSYYCAIHQGMNAQVVVT